MPALTASKQVLVAHLEEEAVLLNLETKGYYRLNETGAVIWKAIENGVGRDAIVDQLTSTFDVPPDEAKRELDRIIDELRDNKLLTEEET